MYFDDFDYEKDYKEASQYRLQMGAKGESDILQYLLSLPELQNNYIITDVKNIRPNNADVDIMIISTKGIIIIESKNWSGNIYMDYNKDYSVQYIEDKQNILRNNPLRSIVNSAKYTNQLLEKDFTNIVIHKFLVFSEKADTIKTNKEALDSEGLLFKFDWFRNKFKKFITNQKDVYTEDEVLSLFNFFKEKCTFKIENEPESSSIVKIKDIDINDIIKLINRKERLVKYLTIQTIKLEKEKKEFTQETNSNIRQINETYDNLVKNFKSEFINTEVDLNSMTNINSIRKDYDNKIVELQAKRNNEINNYRSQRGKDYSNLEKELNSIYSNIGKYKDDIKDLNALIRLINTVRG